MELNSQTHPSPPRVDTGEPQQSGHFVVPRHAYRNSQTPPGVRSSPMHAILNKPYDSRHPKGGSSNGSCTRYETLNRGVQKEKDASPISSPVTRDRNIGSTDFQLPVSHVEAAHSSDSSPSTTERGNPVSDEEEEEEEDGEVGLNGYELDRSDVDSHAGNREEEREFGRACSPIQHKSKCKFV